MFTKKEKGLGSDGALIIVQRLNKIIPIRNDLVHAVSMLDRYHLLEAHLIMAGNNWPSFIPGIPDDWDEMSHETRGEILSDALCYIEDRVSLKERLRHDRKNRYNETEEQFNDWWESRVVTALEQIASRL